MYVVLQRKRQSAEDKVEKEHSVCGYINKNIYMNIFYYVIVIKINYQK